MKVVLNGANGFMGRLCAEEFSKFGHEIVAKVDVCGENFLPRLDEYKGEADIVVDFSFHTAAAEVVKFALSRNIPALIATTGHTEEEKTLIFAASKKIPIFYSGNTSIGVAMLVDFAKRTAEVFKDAEIEIVETHHDRKADAPSGTALMIAQAVSETRDGARIVCGRSGSEKRQKNDIGISSVRLANVVGVHEVYISNGLETITLRHEAHDRRLFAQGAVKAAEFMFGKPVGLYDIRSMK